MRLRFLFFCLAFTTAAWADPAADFVRLHTEAIGGAARIAEFKTMRATGYVRIGERTLRMGIVAERPNHIRTVIQAEGSTLTQAYDGVHPPWQISASSPEPQLLDEDSAREFIADAEFDDPLIHPAERGYAIDYAGETTLDGRRVVRLLVAYKLTETFELLLDGETYFIVSRLSTRRQSGGREAKLETRFADFRPVAGVIMPYRTSVYANGRLLHETVIEEVEANPPVPPFVFSLTPAAEVKVGKK